MSKTYTPDQIKLLAISRGLKRNLKKGDFIIAGEGTHTGIEQLLREGDVQFVSLPYTFGAQLITIN